MGAVSAVVADMGLLAESAKDHGYLYVLRLRRPSAAASPRALWAAVTQSENTITSD